MSIWNMEHRLCVTASKEEGVAISARQLEASGPAFLRTAKEEGNVENHSRVRVRGVERRVESLWLHPAFEDPGLLKTEETPKQSCENFDLF